MHARSLLSVLVLSLSFPLVLSCGDDEEDGDELPDIEIPDEYQAGEAAIALRLTNAASSDESTTQALNNIFNNRISLFDLLMRGGLPESGELVADVTGTSPEIVKYYAENGIVDPAEATDSCGNPIIAAFVTPEAMATAYGGIDSNDVAGVWPDACGSDQSCDTSEQGIVDVQLTKMRYDGMVDVILAVHKSVHTGSPALLGHLMGVMPTTNNIGVTTVPLFADVQQANLMISGLLEYRLTQVNEKGVQQTYVFPHMSRSLSTGDVSITLMGHEDCDGQWEDRFDGEIPYGCDPEAGLTKPLQLEVNSDRGSWLYDNAMAGGDDPYYLDRLQDAFQFYLGSSLSCPPVRTKAWIQDGPVELFLCPSGEIELCIAEQDMEDAGCTAHIDAPASAIGAFSQRNLAMPLTTSDAPVEIMADTETPGSEYYVSYAATAGEVLVVYTAQGSLIEDVLDSSGKVVSGAIQSLDDSHCTGDVVKRLELSFDSAGTYYLQLGLSAGGSMQLMATDTDHWMP